MDNFDFVQLYWKENNMVEFNWNSKMKGEETPPEFILIPIGEYNGVDLLDCIVDENYIVWLEIPNSEYGEVIM